MKSCIGARPHYINFRVEYAFINGGKYELVLSNG